jgi:hypothetical protein
MRAFTCSHCGQRVFFENSLCLRCSTALGYVPSRLELVALEPDDPLTGNLSRCANAGVAACNWMLEQPDPGPLCRSCRLTRTRPADEHEAFVTAESAKRRLLHQLFDLRLEVDEQRLRFDLLSSRAGPVLTGHDGGVITIDLAESDDARREQRRAELGEPYRTMLGHFRHEIGHYYWPSLVAHSGAELERFRALFGDERLDYDSALQRHYASGPPPDWNARHASAYASMHPWEDWAETFAHYLHIRDTLQTTSEYGLFLATTRHAPGDSPAAQADTPDRPFQAIFDDWLPLSYALNAVNRSMGRDDLYPFSLAATVVEKLAYVHDRVREGRFSGSLAQTHGL